MSVDVDLSSELEASELELKTLLVERERLPDETRAAARSVDVARLRALKLRAVEIEVDLFAARARALRLRIEHNERAQSLIKATLGERESAKIRAAEEARRMADLAQEAMQEWNAVSVAVEMERNRLELNRQDTLRLRRELDELISSQSQEV